MANELSLQQKFQEKVAENIKSTFLDLIPKEDFDKMVAAGMTDFLQGTKYQRNSHQYNPCNDPNTLPGMIMVELKEMAKLEIKKVLDSEDFKTTWNPNGSCRASIAVKEALTKNPEVFVQALFGGIVQQTLQQIQYNMK